MNDFKIVSALGHYILVTPVDKSTVLKTEETATVFRVISCGYEWLEVYGKSLACGIDEAEVSLKLSKVLIIVSPNSVEKTMMGHQEVWYVRDSDIIATVSEE